MELDEPLALGGWFNHSHSQHTNATCTLGITEICNQTPDGLFDMYRVVTVCGAGVAMLSFMMGSCFHRLQIGSIPESLLVVILGAGLGLGLFMTSYVGHGESLNESLLRFSFEICLKTLALPVIIFEAGWSLRLRDFISQFGYIMFFAIIGTILSVIVVANLMYWTSYIHGITQWRTCIAYASLISSVDPVATLATFGALNVDPLLFILVFGESQINDAVAITLFETLNHQDQGDPVKLGLDMIKLLTGSIGIGVGLAMVYLIIMRVTKMGHSLSNGILFLFMSSLFTYSFSEFCNFSGIITVLFNAMIMGAYAPCHFGPDGTSLASFLFKQAASMCDTMIFLFCGVSVVFIVQEHAVAGTVNGLTFGLLMCTFCMVGRFFAIVPLGLLSNAIKMCVARKLPAERRNIISPSHLFMMWHSGLRGGVSLVLAMELRDWVDKTEGPHAKTEMINGTFTVVVVYLIVFGSTTGFCLRLLGLPIGEEASKVQLYETGDKNGCFWRCLRYSRKKIFAPLLVGREIHGPPGAHALVRRNSSRRDASAAPASTVTSADPHHLAPPIGTLRTTTGPLPEITGILTSVIEDASRRNLGGRHLRHSIAALPGMPRFSVHALFGTSDPAHIENVEDVEDDLWSCEDDGLEEESGEDGSSSEWSGSHRSDDASDDEEKVTRDHSVPLRSGGSAAPARRCDASPGLSL